MMPHVSTFILAPMHFTREHWYLGIVGRVAGDMSQKMRCESKGPLHNNLRKTF